MAATPEVPAVTSHTCWVDPAWLAHCGGVRPENALEYFERSPFFARGEGIEFALTPIHDPRCVGVVKRRRRSARVAENEACGAAASFYAARVLGGLTRRALLLRFYYILNGTIYQCPAIDELAQSRLRKCSHHVAEAYSEMQRLCRAQEGPGPPPGR